MSALAGRNVVVTRPREQAAGICAALEAHGARPIPAPTIEMERVRSDAVDATVAALDRYDWIVFTSANAVAAFWEALGEAGRTAPPTTRLAAVGTATRLAVEDRGGRVAAMPPVFRGAEIPAALESLGGRRVLLPRSDIAREETAAALRAAGAVVDEVVVYRTVARSLPDTVLRRLAGGVDAVTFTSPSTVRGFLEAGGAVAERVLRTSVIACIGPTTAREVRALGYAVPVEPAEHTAAGLVESLERYFALRLDAGVEGKP